MNYQAAVIYQTIILVWQGFAKSFATHNQLKQQKHQAKNIKKGINNIIVKLLDLITKNNTLTFFLRTMGGSYDRCY